MSRRPARPVLVATITAILLACPVASGELCAGSAAASRLVERGDAIFDQSRSVQQAWRAVWTVEQALKLAPACFEASWRVARAYSWIAELEQDRGGNPAAGQKGYEAAQRAIGLAPKRVEGHYWAAICVGQYGNGLGVLRAIRQGINGKLKRHLQDAQQIAPGYDDGGADRVLALYYRAVPWPLRSKKKSYDHFERSLRHSPRHPRTLLHLADALAADGRKPEAFLRLKTCASLGEQEGSPRLNRHYLWRCRKRLEQLSR